MWKRSSLLDEIDWRRITRDRGSPRGSCLVRVMSLLLRARNPTSEFCGVQSYGQLRRLARSPRLHLRAMAVCRSTTEGLDILIGRSGRNQETLHNAHKKPPTAGRRNISDRDPSHRSAATTRLYPCPTLRRFRYAHAQNHRRNSWCRSDPYVPLHRLWVGVGFGRSRRPFCMTGTLSPPG